MDNDQKSLLNGPFLIANGKETPDVTQISSGSLKTKYLN